MKDILSYIPIIFSASLALILGIAAFLGLKDGVKKNFKLKGTIDIIWNEKEGDLGKEKSE